MKILAIRAQNLASLAGPVDVDLEGPPLGNAGVFAIVGPTGAGKSTLLDALCLALFDKTPRLANRGGPLVGDVTDAAETRLSSHDVRGLIRRGQSFGWAEVDFRVEGGARYRARWEARRARNLATGRFQAQTMTLLDLATGERLGDKKTEVLHLIEEKLGLSFEQFQRSVLLAQGEFAAFLRAPVAERSELLEKMTRTEVYGELSIVAYQRHKEVLQAYQEIVAQRDQLGVLNDERRLELEGLEAGYTDEMNQKRADLERLRAVVSVWDNKMRLAEQAELARQRLEGAEVTWAECAAERLWLQGLDVVEPVRERVGRVSEAHQRVVAVEQYLAAITLEVELVQREATAAQLAVEQATAVREETRKEYSEQAPRLVEARRLDQQVALTREVVVRTAREWEAAKTRETDVSEQRKRLDGEWEELLRTLAETETALKHKEQLGPVVAQWDRVEAELRAWARWRGEQSAAKDRMDGATAEWERLTVQAAATKKEEEAVRESLKRVTDAWVVADKLALETPLGPLVERRKHAEGVREVLQSVLAVAVTKSRVSQKTLELNARLAEQKGRELATIADLERENRTLEAHHGVLDEAKRARELARRAMDLTEHRSLLVNGEACPLCGSEEHPWAGLAPPLSSLFQSLNNRVAEVEGDYQRVVRHIAELTALKGNTVAEQIRLSEELGEVAQQLAEVNQQWSDVVTRATEIQVELCPVDGGFNEEVSEAERIRYLLAEATTAWEEVCTLEKQALEIHHQVTERLRARDAVRETLEGKIQQNRELEDVLRRMEHERASAQVGWDRAAEELQRQRPWLQQHLDGFPKWEDVDPKTVTVFLGRLEKEVVAYRALIEKRQQIETKKTQLEGQKKATAEMLTETGLVRGEREREHQVATDDAARVLALRAALWGGQLTDVVEAQYRRRFEEVDNAVEKAQRAMAEKNHQRAVAQGRQTQTLTELAGLRAEYAEGMRVRDEMVAALGLTLDEVVVRLAVNPETRRAVLTKVEQVGQERVLAERTRVEREQERDLYFQQHPTDGEREDVVRAVAEVDATLQVVVEKRSEVRALLAQDQKKQDMAVELGREIVKKKAELDVYATLNELIGSADGKKFRTFAQSLTLDSLLALANHHLVDLAPRYRLERIVGQDLDLQVRDREMGDDARALQSLSGGETFLASLALALALSSLAKTSTQIESLFIDEGFGTLDNETLELVLHTLDSLQALGRQVGIISHVATLAERIGTRIELLPVGGGRSEVRIRQR